MFYIRALISVCFSFAVMLGATLKAEARFESRVVPVEGLIYADLNDNLIRDEGEPGIAEVSLEFSNGTDPSVLTLSEEGGRYHVSLIPGLWRIRVTPPAGYEIPENYVSELPVEEDVNPPVHEIGLRYVGLTEEDPSIEVEVENKEVIKEPDSQPDVYQIGTESGLDGEPSELEGGLSLLPESGGILPSRWMGLMASVVLLLAAGFVRAMGRKVLSNFDDPQ